MREELHLMELVDRYLEGGMGSTELGAFEERMRVNAELGRLVDEQRSLRAGLERLHLRGVAEGAHRHWSMMRWLPWVVGSTLVIGVTVGIGLYLGTEREVTSVDGNILSGDELPSHVENLLDTIDADIVEATKVETMYLEARGTLRLLTAETPPTVRPEERVQEGPAPISPVEGGPILDQAEDEEVVANLLDAGRNADSSMVSFTRSSLASRQHGAPLIATVEVPASATAQPTFPGGVEAMQNFISEHLRHPRGMDRSGTVTVGFTVNKKGAVVNVDVISGMSPAYDAEALWVIKAMPDWSPCSVGERTVRSRVVVPIRFIPVKRKAARAR